MNKITLLVGLWLLPTLCLADQGKPQQQNPEVQQQTPKEQSGIPPRTLIIRVKTNAKGEEEANAEVIPSTFDKPVVSSETAMAANKTMTGVEPIVITEKGGEGVPCRELQLMFDLQDLIAVDPLNQHADSVSDANSRWNYHHNSGFYGYGHRGNWGYRTSNRYANYGYLYNRLFYPYSSYGYSYPYGGYNHYYYYNPYYY